MEEMYGVCVRARATPMMVLLEASVASVHAMWQVYTHVYMSKVHTLNPHPCV